MEKVVCVMCENEIVRYSYFVELANKCNVCESCFFDIAIKKLGAKEMQVGFDEIIDVKVDREENYNSYCDQ